MATELNKNWNRQTADVVGAVAVNHMAITDAVVSLKREGIPTFALFNDFAQGERQTYIGTNNLKVGRSAAWMLGTAIKNPGKIALFVGGHRWHGHELRETGFRSYFREAKPDFVILDTLVNLETTQLTYEATLDLLYRHQDIVGIYITGGGMEGAIEAIREVRKPGEVALVVNELTPISRKALIDGICTMVISTPLRQLCRELIVMMSAPILNENARIPSQRFLDGVIKLPESV